MKNYEELTFADNFMFCKILEENEDLCREMAELILGRKIGNIVKDPQSEKAVKLTADGHGVRFDVYFEDDEQSIYDIEMQTSESKELPKRSRYYQGMLDLNYLKQGKKYKDLPNSYIIFLCTFDLFKRGFHKYSFNPTSNEDSTLKLDDGTNRIFICAGGTKNDISDDLASFIDYLTGKISENPLVQDLERKVQEALNDQRWKAEYMTFQDILDDEYERGIGEGIQQGTKREQRKNLCKLIRQVLKNHKAGKTIEEIADVLDESEDYIRRIVEVSEKFAPEYDVEKIADALLEDDNEDKHS